MAVKVTEPGAPRARVFMVGDTAMYSGPVGAELFVRGERLTPDRRSELRAKLKAGELDEIVFDAVVYRDGPNANHTRFKPSDLAGFASSFAGSPFLRNHETGDIGARDGTILDSRLVGSEIHQTIRLTTERGMKDFLEGVIDRFSIGWYFEGVECSVCRMDWMECNHWPGQKYDGQACPGRICELIFISPRGKETSAVNAPAVQGTRVIEQLCVLKVGNRSEQIGNRGEGDPSVSYFLSPSSPIFYSEKERGMSVENAIVLPDGSLKVVEPIAAGVGSPLGPTNGLQGMQTGESSAGADLAAEVRLLRSQIDAERIEQAISRSGLSDESRTMLTLAAEGKDLRAVLQLIDAQKAVEAKRVDAQIVRGVRPIVTEGMMMTPKDQVQSALSWLFGVKDEPTPPPSIRDIRLLYQAMTGDHNWYGVFNPEWAQLAAATTTTLAGMVVNSLNKVTKLHYDNMGTYRWYENIVDVTPHDGSTHDVSLITMDGLSNLPTVSEGAPYTEATVGDARETMSFAKRGHYVGITLETIRRSDIQRLQAIPRLMVQASIRSRSAAIASIFTINTSTGPTLAQDSVALFHATHANTSTTAFSAAEWEACRVRIFEQVVPGTGKPLGLWPAYVLTPVELYEDALILFGYGTGDVGRLGVSFGQVVNPYGEARMGDPRPIPIVGPDWTDATNFAYIVDPRLHPVIHMSFANAPQGGAHPMPGSFEVTSETSGLMFTNDTLPVKVRDWWSYGVSTYVGIGNNIVA